MREIQTKPKKNRRMGVRNSKYGPGVMLDNNGCVVQMASCCNPYFTSQFQNNNQSCFVKPNLLNMYKQDSNKLNLATLSTMSNLSNMNNINLNNNFSCELPHKPFIRNEQFMPVGSSPAFFKPPNNYYGTRTFSKPPLPQFFHQKQLANLPFNQKNQVVQSFQNKFYRTPYSQQSMLVTNSIATPVSGQMRSEMANQIPNQMTNSMSTQMANQMAKQLVNQMANQIALQMPQMSNSMANTIVIPQQNRENLLPKPNQITLTSSHGVRFPMPLAMPYGQPLIENFNPANTLDNQRSFAHEIDLGANEHNIVVFSPDV